MHALRPCCQPAELLLLLPLLLLLEREAAAGHLVRWVALPSCRWGLLSMLFPGVTEVSEVEEAKGVLMGNMERCLLQKQAPHGKIVQRRMEMGGKMEMEEGASLLGDCLRSSA